MAESDNILTKLHDVLLYVIPQRNKFPRDQRFVSVLAQKMKRSRLARLGRALGVLLFLVSAVAYGQGIAQRDSEDFTLDTTGTPVGVGGTAQRDSTDFVLNTTGESPGVYRDSQLFTLDTGGPGPAMLSAPAYLSGNRFQFSVGGAAGLEYVIQVNTNLSTANWVSLFTNTTPFTFTDILAGSFAQRFYRAVPALK